MFQPESKGAVKGCFPQKPGKLVIANEPEKVDLCFQHKKYVISENQGK